jgi:hypothetical protein
LQVSAVSFAALRILSDGAFMQEGQQQYGSALKKYIQLHGFVVQLHRFNSAMAAQFRLLLPIHE